MRSSDRQTDPLSSRLRDLNSNSSLASPGYSDSYQQTTSGEEFFDLDIESYYANGNNACGFIPGAPDQFDTDFLSEGESILETSRYDGRLGTDQE